VPFFFEPNFDAIVKPLDAVVRAQTAAGEQVEEGKYQSIVYGEFLKKKVGSNFSATTPGKGKYD